MKKSTTLFCLLAGLLLAAVCPAMGQETSVPAEISEAFPGAARLKEVPDVWYAVYNDKGRVLGYAAYSKPHSDGISGFAGETPLMICFSPKYRIRSVVLLDNEETPGFVRRVEAAGLFDSWTNMTIGEALNTTPDAVSGATFTSTSVINSFQACIEYLVDHAPQKAVQRGGSRLWLWIAIGVAAAGACIALGARSHRRRVAVA